MKKNKFKSVICIASAILTLAVVTTGSLSASTSSAAQKIKIVVATGGQPKPFSYVDNNNKITGYDIEVVRAIFKDLPQYDVSIQKTEFASIFAGLDSDRFQIGANNFAANAQRKEKYYFSNPIFKNQYVIVVPSSNTTIKSFKDLLGKTTEVQTGVNYTTALVNYNTKNPANPVKLTYSQADMVTVLQHVESGKFDFQLIDRAMVVQYIKEYKLKLKVIPLTQKDSDLIGAPYSYLIISKGAEGKKLLKDVNTALAKEIKKGTIAKISQKFLGGNYVPKSAS